MRDPNLATSRARSLIAARSLQDQPDAIEDLADEVLCQAAIIPDAEFGLLVAAELRFTARMLRAPKGNQAQNQK